jgi:hypothetical protein
MKFNGRIKADVLHKFDEQQLVVVPRANNPGETDVQVLSLQDFVIVGVVNEDVTVVD